MPCVCRRYDRDVQKIKMAAVLQLKINNYILETRISFLHSDNRKNLTWVFIRMCTIVTSSDMTSFIYIGNEKHHLSKWLGNDPQQKEIELSLLSDCKESKECKKALMMMMMMSWSLTTHQPFWVISVIKVR